MHCILLEFKPLPGKEVDFIEAWKNLTIHILQNYGSKGSRLHRSKEGKYIAYAQWPSKEVYGNIQGTKEGDELRKELLQHLEKDGIAVLEQLQVMEDLLEK